MTNDSRDKAFSMANPHRLSSHRTTSSYVETRRNAVGLLSRQVKLHQEPAQAFLAFCRTRPNLCVPASRGVSVKRFVRACVGRLYRSAVQLARMSPNVDTRSIDDLNRGHKSNQGSSIRASQRYTDSSFNIHFVIPLCKRRQSPYACRDDRDWTWLCFFQN